jgi:hypothetical protein
VLLNSRIAGKSSWIDLPGRASSAVGSSASATAVVPAGAGSKASAFILDEPPHGAVGSSYVGLTCCLEERMLWLSTSVLKEAASKGPRYSTFSKSHQYR